MSRTYYYNVYVMKDGVQIIGNKWPIRAAVDEAAKFHNKLVPDCIFTYRIVCRPK